MNAINPLAITGIHTHVGKTVTAAVLTQALQCHYWKPIQAGDVLHGDSKIITNLLSNAHSQVLPEAYRLNTAASPHLAAQIDNINITLDSLAAPKISPLIIESAGGVLSPVNAQATVADLLAHHGWSTVLVMQHYLGSINHTLAAIEALQQRGISIIGLIVNGHADESSESFITNYSQLKIIAHIPFFDALNASTIATYAENLRNNLPNELTSWLNPL